MVCSFLWEKVMKGKEYGVSFPTTMEWVSRGLRKYVNQDRFGIYKKENVKRILEEEKYALFKNIYEKGQSGRTENVFPNYLNDEQKKIVSEYFLNVGKRATKAEEDFLEYQGKIISEQLEICKSEKAKNKNIGEKLGFGVGLAVFILIL